MAESAAPTRLLRPGSTRQRDRREVETHVRREPEAPLRKVERDDPPALRPFARAGSGEEPKSLATFAATPDDTPLAVTWGSRTP